MNATTNGHARQQQDSLAERMLPHSVEAEMSVIGGCLLDPSVIDEVQSIVTDRQFYSTAHALIFGSIAGLHGRGKRVDAVLVSHDLEAQGELENAGGPMVLARCLEAVPHAMHTHYYAEIVRENWIRREVIEAWGRAAECAFDPVWPIEDVLAEHDQSTQRLIETGVGAEDIVAIGDMLAAALSPAAESRMGISTGFVALDQMAGGMRGGNLILIAARASVGKTALALTVTLSAVRRKHNVLFLSLEMGRLEVAERLVSMQSGVPAFALRRGQFSARDSEAIEACRLVLNELTLFIDDRGDQTISRIGATVRLFKRRHGIELVVIDYLQLIEPEDSRVNREQQVARVARKLKALARSVDLPIVVLCQLNREVEKAADKKPRLSMLRESGSLEQEADQVWLIHREDYHHVGEPDYTETGEAQLIVAKNRNGPTGTINLAWCKRTMHFSEADQSEFWDAPAQQQVLEHWT